MYLPKHFSVDEETAWKLIEQYPLATIITQDENGSPYVNHIPVIIKSGNGKRFLQGHFAKRNPQYFHLCKNATVLLIFQGPNAYISPTWYVSGRDVPTWNYAVVHVQGSISLFEKSEQLVEIVKNISHHFESEREYPWEFELPEDLSDPGELEKAIVGFEIEIKKIEGKYKLSQNRSSEDQSSVINHLEKMNMDSARSMIQLMKKNLKVSPSSASPKKGQQPT